MTYILVIYTLAVANVGGDLKVTTDRVTAGTYESLALCYSEAKRLKLPIETFACLRKN